jgi:hypothetical protein
MVVMLFYAHERTSTSRRSWRDLCEICNRTSDNPMYVNFLELRKCEVRGTHLSARRRLIATINRTSEISAKCVSARSKGNITDIPLFGKEDTKRDVLVQPHNPYV